MFGTTLLIILASSQLFANIVICAPLPSPHPSPDNSNQIDNSYSGAGGNASGGSVTTSPNTNGLSSILGEANLVNVFSGNGGPGGSANSGDAVHRPGSVAIGPGSSATTDPNASSGSASRYDGGNTYSGAGGNAKGGDVSSGGGLVRISSDNGGEGGHASSGQSGSLSFVPIPFPSLAGPRRGKIRIARFYKINLV